MRPPRIVIDTNVLVSAIRSNKGASYRLLTMIADKKYELCVSVPLVLEYEAAMKRQALRSGLTDQDVEDIIDYICAVARHQKVAYLWRPLLKDPADDMVLELAVGAGCKHLVTFNTYDFSGAESLGLQVVKPGQFPQALGGLP